MQRSTSGISDRLVVHITLGDERPETGSTIRTTSTINLMLKQSPLSKDSEYFGVSLQTDGRILKSHC
jgi:hypothetical protein